MEPCRNCGAVRTGRFCPACGQAEVRLDASTWEVVRDNVADALDVDGRLWRTAIALVRPGALTLAFWQGQRVSYLGPFKLATAATAVLTTVWVATRGVDQRFYGYAADQWLGPEAYIALVVRSVLVGGGAMSVAAWAFERGRRRLWETTVFAAHELAALLLWSSVVLLAATAWKVAFGRVDAVPEALPSLVWWCFLPAAVAGVVRLGLAIRRVFGGGWWSAVARTAGLALAGGGAAWVALPHLGGG